MRCNNVITPATMASSRYGNVLILISRGILWPRLRICIFAPIIVFRVDSGRLIDSRLNHSIRSENLHRNGDFRFFSVQLAKMFAAKLVAGFKGEVHLAAELDEKKIIKFVNFRPFPNDCIFATNYPNAIISGVLKRTHRELFISACFTWKFSPLQSLGSQRK